MGDHEISTRCGQVAPCEHCYFRHTCFLCECLAEEQVQGDGFLKGRCEVAAGDRLVRYDEPYSSLLLVCDGAVKTQRVTRNGDLAVTGFALPGDVVGIEALLDKRYPYEVVAVSDALLFRLDIDRMMLVCAAKPGLRDWVISTFARHARQKEDDFSLAMHLPTEYRVLRFFLHLRERLQDGNGSPHGHIQTPMKKQDIARYLNITPETLSRSLGRLRKHNLLQMEGTGFNLPDVEQARRLTNC